MTALVLRRQKSDADDSADINIIRFTVSKLFLVGGTSAV